VAGYIYRNEVSPCRPPPGSRIRTRSPIPVQCTNRAWCTLTSLIKTNALPVRQTATVNVCYGPVSVCLSVCLPQVGVLQIVETYHYANNIAIGFWSSDVKRICEIPVGYSQQGRQIQVAYEKLRLSTNSYISLYLKKCENRHIDSVIDEQEEQNTLSNGDIVDDLEWP